MVRCSDGGVVALDWLRLDRREADTEAIVLHLPGKVGKYGNRYISRAAEILPFRSVVKSWRGICCDLAPESPRTETWDQRAVQDTLDVARHLKRCYPHAPLLLLGWSHGGNVALAALAQGRELFSAGLVVSAPSDLSLAIPFVEGRQWFPYAFANALAIVKEMREPNQQALAAVMPQVAERINTVKDQLSWRNLAMHFWVRRGYGSLYHDLFTRYFSKHDSVSEYLSSLGEMVEEALPKIAVPTLCLLSEDDPVTPALSFSHLLHHGSASVAFAVTKSGGHCGWFCGWSAVSWANEVALEFFQEVLQKTTPSQ
ncbi:unnamed protein product [Effrenium voratum]|nr:unnamed protein product [Effrenium voratum]